MWRRTRPSSYSLMNQELQKIGPMIPHQSTDNARGRVIRRNWFFRNAQWCSLCNEPMSSLTSHPGRRDHTLRENYYSAMVDQPRTWDAEKVFKTFKHRFGEGVVRYHEKYGSNSESSRREELHSMLRYLISKNILQPVTLEDPSIWFQKFAPSMMGDLYAPEMALRRYITSTLVRLLPYGSISNLSGFMDFIVVSWNLESVYDLCGFRALERNMSKPKFNKLDISSPLAFGLGWSSVAPVLESQDTGGKRSGSHRPGFSAGGGPLRSRNHKKKKKRLANRWAKEEEEEMNAELSRSATEELSSFAEKDFSSGAQENLKEHLDESGEESSAAAFQGSLELNSSSGGVHSRKASFVRSLLGQMRFTLDNSAKLHPMGLEINDKDKMIMELASRYLVVEAINCRFLEYSSTVEPVWIREGFERASPNKMEMLQNLEGTRNMSCYPPFERTDFENRPATAENHHLKSVYPYGMVRWDPRALEVAPSETTTTDGKNQLSGYGGATTSQGLRHHQHGSKYSGGGSQPQRRKFSFHPKITAFVEKMKQSNSMWPKKRIQLLSEAKIEKQAILEKFVSLPSVDDHSVPPTGSTDPPESK